MAANFNPRTFKAPKNSELDVSLVLGECYQWLLKGKHNIPAEILDDDPKELILAILAVHFANMGLLTAVCEDLTPEEVRRVYEYAASFGDSRSEMFKHLYKVCLSNVKPHCLAAGANDLLDTALMTGAERDSASTVHMVLRMGSTRVNDAMACAIKAESISVVESLLRVKEVSLDAALQCAKDHKKYEALFAIMKFLKERQQAGAAAAPSSQ